MTCDDGKAFETVLEAFGATLNREEAARPTAFNIFSSFLGENYKRVFSERTVKSEGNA
jgi:hypothetical protein